MPRNQRITTEVFSLLKLSFQSKFHQKFLKSTHTHQMFKEITFKIVFLGLNCGRFPSGITSKSVLATSKIWPGSAATARWRNAAQGRKEGVEEEEGPRRAGCWGSVADLARRRTNRRWAPRNTVVNRMCCTQNNQQKIFLLSDERKIVM